MLVSPLDQRETARSLTARGIRVVHAGLNKGLHT
jgi:hypothetical protein